MEGERAGERVGCWLLLKSNDTDAPVSTLLNSRDSGIRPNDSAKKSAFFALVCSWLSLRLFCLLLSGNDVFELNRHSLLSLLIKAIHARAESLSGEQRGLNRLGPPGVESLSNEQ